MFLKGWTNSNCFCSKFFVISQPKDQKCAGLLCIRLLHTNSTDLFSYMAPTPFKIHINKALKKWKKHCEVVGIPINDKFLYTLLFADDQVVVAMDGQDCSYMIRKLHKQC